MSVDVRCPECSTAHKAPDQAVGRKVKCRKCGVPFRVPGTPAPVPAAGANDTFNGIRAADSVDLKGVDPATIPTGDPFSFDGPAAPTVSDATPMPKDKAKSKSKYSTRNLAQKPAPPGGGAKKWLLIGGLAVACAGAGAAAAVFALGGPNAVTPSVAQAEKPADDKKPKAAANAKSAEKAKEMEPEPDAPAPVTIPPVTAPKAEKPNDKLPRAARGGVTVAGGLTFPKAPGKSALVEKSTARVNLEIEPAKVRRLLTTGPDAQMLGVVTPGFAGFQGRGAKDVLERYSLASGKLIDKFEFDAGPPPSRALDLSPAGDQLAAEYPGGKVTVWDVFGKQKLLDGVEPFPEIPGEKPRVVGLFFTDEGRLAVVGSHGAADVWDVRGKVKKVTGDPAVTQEKTRVGTQDVAITPDRKSVLVCADGGVYEIPLKTGKPKPGLTLPRKPAIGCHCLAADPAGTRVAVAYTAMDPAPHTVVAVGRLGEPKEPTIFFLAPEAGTPVAAGWPAQDTLVVSFLHSGAAAVFDLEVNKLIAVMHPAGGGPHLPGQATGRHAALVTTDAKDPKKTVFTAFPFPHDGYFPLRAAAAAAPVPLVILPDGLAK